MIILKDKDLYVDCSCGTKFIAMDGDFKLNPLTQKLFTNCPTCDETYYVIFSELDVEKPEIKGEKIENESL